MNLSLRDIEYFLAVLEHGGVERAACACGLSQPALSKSLRRLEDDTGLALFDRGGRRLRLTSAGQVFALHAQALRGQYRDAVRHAMELRAGAAGLLRVGATGATMDAVVVPALRFLLPRRPALRVELSQGLSDALNAQVVDGQLDFAVAPLYADPPASVDHEVIRGDSPCVAASALHPLAGRRKVTLRDVADFRWMLPKRNAVSRQALDARFVAAGLEPPLAAVDLEHVSRGLLGLLADSDLLALIPLSALTADLVALPVALGMPLQRRIALISRRGAIWSPLMTEFRAALLN